MAQRGLRFGFFKTRSGHNNRGRSPVLISSGDGNPLYTPDIPHGHPNDFFSVLRQEISDRNQEAIYESATSDDYPLAIEAGAGSITITEGHRHEEEKTVREWKALATKGFFFPRSQPTPTGLLSGGILVDWTAPTRIAWLTVYGDAIEHLYVRFLVTLPIAGSAPQLQLVVDLYDDSGAGNTLVLIRSVPIAIGAPTLRQKEWIELPLLDTRDWFESGSPLSKKIYIAITASVQNAANTAAIFEAQVSHLAGK